MSYNWFIYILIFMSQTQFEPNTQTQIIIFSAIYIYKKTSCCYPFIYRIRISGVRLAWTCHLTTMQKSLTDNKMSKTVSRIYVANKSCDQLQLGFQFYTTNWLITASSLSMYKGAYWVKFIATLYAGSVSGLSTLFFPSRFSWNQFRSHICGCLYY